MSLRPHANQIKPDSDPRQFVCILHIEKNFAEPEAFTEHVIKEHDVNPIDAANFLGHLKEGQKVRFREYPRTVELSYQDMDSLIEHADKRRSDVSI